MVNLRKALGVHGLTHSPAEFGELLGSSQTQFLTMMLDQEKPVSAPGHISLDRAASRNVYLDRFLCPPARDVQDRNLARLMQRGSDDPHRRFDSMVTGANSSQMSQGDHQADGA